jgi:rhamnosyltransferase
VIIVAVVVSYHPVIEHLARLCRSLVASGARIIIVDNTESGGDEPGFIMESCTRIALAENTGIAHAQNVGIARAIEDGADVIVFFDQDSEPDASFLSRLLADLKPGEPAVAAPVCVDKVSGQELPSYRLSPMGLRRKVISEGHTAPYPVDLVIASGSAATAVTFSRVGNMDEDFFIDFVDFEWCLRCRSHRVPMHVVPSAVMLHSIGERTVNLRVIRGSVHGVSRSYYKIRNCFLLFRKPDVPLLFAISSTLFAMIRFVMLLPFVSNRLAYVKVFLMAIGHGIRGVVGKNPELARRREPN